MSMQAIVLLHTKKTLPRSQTVPSGSYSGIPNLMQHMDPIGTCSTMPGPHWQTQHRNMHLGFGPFVLGVRLVLASNA